MTALRNTLKELEINCTPEIRSSLETLLDEVFENREQIEISRFYERLPKTNAMALKEFLDDKVYFRKASESDDQA